jgi:EAL domain-containing protein (putative c-di-GMP-specific phosphodiesterase class I)/GGDEF domain-containing protein
MNREENIQNLYQASYRNRKLKIHNGTRLAKDIEELRKEESGGKNHYLICFNIQGLKDIYEAYNLKIAELLLSAICGWIQGLPEFQATLYRTTDEVFTLLLKNKSEWEAINISGTINARFNMPWEIILDEGVSQSIFVNTAVCVIPFFRYSLSCEELPALIQRLFEIAGKDSSIPFFDDKLAEDYQKEQCLVEELKKCALTGMKGFSVDYQPFVDPVAGIWIGVEALCRWESPETGPLAPADFIPLMERTGLMDSIGQWLVEEAISKIKKWNLDTAAQFCLDVNISLGQLQKYTLTGEIQKLLKKYNYPPEKLTLEITQSGNLRFTDAFFSSLILLHKTGVNIALDDFGLNQGFLSRFNMQLISCIKIGASSLKDLRKDSYLERMLHTIVEFAHNTNLKVTVKTVEDEDHLRFLLNHGVDYLQGNFFSKPLSDREIPDHINNFFNSLNVFPVKTLNNIDINKLNKPGGGYVLTTASYQLISHCMYILHTEQDTAKALDKVLSIAGEYLDVSRSYIFTVDENFIGENVNEWCAPGVSSEKNNLSNFFVSKTWIKALRENGVILITDIDKLGLKIKAELDRQKVLSLVVLPMWNGDRLFGFIGLDECYKQNRIWKAEEIQFLYLLCILIAGIFKRLRLHNILKIHNKVMDEVLLRMGVLVFMSDLETHRIVYTNKKTREAYGDKKLEGEYCWKVFLNKEGPCEFCPLEGLKLRPHGEVVVSRLHNSLLDRDYTAYDSIVPWHGGKLAHLQYAVEVTKP